MKRHWLTFNKAIELGYAEAHAYSSRGLFHAAMGEYEAAIADYTKAIEKDPKDEVPLVNRGKCVHVRCKYEEASQDYTKAIALNDKNGIYFQHSALSLRSCLANTDKAIEDYNQAIKMNQQTLPLGWDVALSSFN